MPCKSACPFCTQRTIHTPKKFPVSHMAHHNNNFGIPAAQFIHHLPVGNINHLTYLLLGCTYCPYALEGDIHHVFVILLTELFYLSILQIGKTARHIYVNHTAPVPEQVKEECTDIREDIENSPRQQGYRISYPPQSPK